MRIDCVPRALLLALAVVPYLLSLVCIAPGSIAFAAGGGDRPAPMLNLGDDRSVDLEAFRAAGGRCGTQDFGPSELPRAPGKDTADQLQASVQIPVAFHVIYKEVLRNGRYVRVGDVPTAQLDAQLQVLNAAFATYGFSFVRRSVDRRKSATWFGMTMGSSAERDAKTALAIDPARVLNIYTAGLGSNQLGWSYFPWSYAESSTMHGLVLLYSSLPGGVAVPYNEGATATHELGHFFGLYHTFQSGCATPGDYVSDTPFEASPAYGCPEARDSCPSAGRDPITNYMDYTDDGCMTSFTPGQGSRMRWGLQSYKRTMAASYGVAMSPSGTSTSGPKLHLDASPNPFNPTTQLAFRLERPAYVTLQVHDVAGRRVAELMNADLPAGSHRILFEGRGLPSGVYLARIEAGGQQVTHRIVLVK